MSVLGQKNYSRGGAKHSPPGYLGLRPVYMCKCVSKLQAGEKTSISDYNQNMD